jgi:CDP-diacylglycerol---serine O-phosphatidyltransferase
MAWGLTIFAAGSMVSDLKFYSGKDINLKESVPFVAILAIMIAFVLVSYSPPEVLFTVVLVYALSGYYLWAKTYFGKKHETPKE